MYRGRGKRNETLCAHHLDDWEVLPVVLEATADEEGPEKGFIGVIGVLKCVFVLRVTVVGGIRLVRPLPPFSPAGCRRIFQTDALGSTTTAPLLGGSRQLSFSNF